MTANSTDTKPITETQKQGLSESNLKTLIEREIQSLMAGKFQEDSPFFFSNCVMEFADNSHTLNVDYSRVWLLVSGDSCHIATHKFLFTTL